jgi:ribulose-phosphate 3-epimerase
MSAESAMPGGPVRVAPSLMCADFLSLKAQLDLMAETGIDFLHVDIMDGHYVPNFTLGPDFCAAVSSYSPLPLDIHLMIENVDAYIPVFSACGSPALYIHPETSYHPIRSLQLIKSCGARAGVCIDPGLPLEAILPLLPHVELACLMTVNPGYAGQTLVPGSIERIRELAGIIARGGYPVEIEVDGNVSWQNIPSMIEAGARILVAGTSSLFEKGTSLRQNIQRLYGLIGRA